jgi:hypothetical protein
MNPEIIPAGSVIFRDKLPLRNVPVVIKIDRSDSSTIYFEHRLTIGIWVTAGVIINIVGMCLGLLWSFKWNDRNTGFTIAAISGLPMSLVALLVAVLKL